MESRRHTPPPFPGHDLSCPVCESTGLTRGRVSATERDQLDVFACETCGDFWFEREGVRLTAEAMRELGLFK